MILSAQSIRHRGIITPFHERTVVNGMTFGLSCHGYDIRIAERLYLEPGNFVLASSIERFDMPDDICGIVHDKSTWARCGIACQNTVIEAGWRGYLTLEISNHSDMPQQIAAGSPIAQIVFHMLDEPTEQPYAGKYQDQEAGPQAART
jgi:dCTP deaminase